MSILKCAVDVPQPTDELTAEAGNFMLQETYCLELSGPDAIPDGQGDAVTHQQPRSFQRVAGPPAFGLDS